MSVNSHRARRGAFRASPEDILQDAIARHRALRQREELRTPKVAEAAKVARQARPEEEARRARFAEGVARAVFGRFYYKERPR